MSRRNQHEGSEQLNTRTLLETYNQVIANEQPESEHPHISAHDQAMDSYFEGTIDQKLDKN